MQNFVRIGMAVLVYYLRCGVFVDRFVKYVRYDMIRYGGMTQEQFQLV